MRRLIAMVLVLVLAGCGEPEPVHEGKSVSEWLDEVREQELLTEDAMGSLPDIGSQKPVNALAAMGDEAVPFLVEALEDESYFVREAAIEALGKIGVPAVDDLVVAFGHKDPTVRQSAITACAKVGPDAVPDLIEAMKSDTAEVRRGVVEVLDQLGPDAAEAGPALVSALGDPDPGVRSAALITLPKVSPSATQQATDSLVRALDDPVQDVRVEAVRTLGGVDAETQEIAPALFHTLVEGDYRLRAVAVRSLAQLGEASVPVLIDGLGHEDADVRLACVRALADIGQPAVDAVDALTNTLKDEELRVRIVSLTALGNLGPQANRALPAVVAIIRDEGKDDEQHSLRSQAASTAGKIGDGVPEAYHALLEMLREGPEKLRIAAAYALGSMKSDVEEIVAALTSILEITGSKAHAEAIIALGALGPKARSALPQLETRRDEDENEEIRVLAHEAINAIKREPRPSTSTDESTGEPE